MSRFSRLVFLLAAFTSLTAVSAQEAVEAKATEAKPESVVVGKEGSPLKKTPLKKTPLKKTKRSQ